jgi:hypothetical protein
MAERMSDQMKSEAETLQALGMSGAGLTAGRGAHLALTRRADRGGGTGRAGSGR